MFESWGRAMNTRKLRIVVADDHDLMLSVVSDHLSKHFEVVKSVRTGERLVHFAAELRPDVIVSDVNMPNLSGVGAMLRLQGMGLKIPFVMMGADTVDITQLFSQGAAGYVHKYDIHADLVEAVIAAHSGGKFVSRSIPQEARPQMRLHKTSNN
jgi:DNA-binding NarL/FixJ family response regulator